MLYGAAVWDPLLIIAQIVSVQCLYYLSLGLWQAILIAPYAGARLTVATLFDWRLMNFRNYIGWMIIVSNLGNAPLGAMYLLWVVERAKKCLDFGSTCYLLHFIACWVYGGFPASLEWWSANTLGMLIMALMGEWLCVRREMADIPLNSLRANRPAAASLSAPSAASVGSASSSASAPAARGSVGPRTVSASVGGRSASAITSSGGGRGLGVSRSGAGARGSGAATTIQMATLSSTGLVTESGRLSRTNSKSRLLGGDEEV